MQTRYYDPSIGRFISQDSIEYADPQSINGINLYAYCNNNPVMGYDPDGTINWKEFWSKLGRFFAGVASLVIGVAITITNLGLSLISPLHTVFSEIGLTFTFYGAGLIGSAFNNQIYSDMEAIGWNPFNDNADAVLNSGIMSFYKGVPVIRHNIPKTTSCQILGMIFLNVGEKAGTTGRNTLNHEFGHGIQEKLMGSGRYILGIAIPSVINFVVNPGDIWYYSKPWERTADWLGGVNRGGYAKNSLVWSIVYLFLLAGIRF